MRGLTVGLGLIQHIMLDGILSVTDKGVGRNPIPFEVCSLDWLLSAS